MSGVEAVALDFDRVAVGIQIGVEGKMESTWCLKDCNLHRPSCRMNLHAVLQILLS